MDIPEAGGVQATEVEADGGPETANRVSGRVKSRPRWLEDYETNIAMQRDVQLLVADMLHFFLQAGFFLEGGSVALVLVLR
jgi:hypothetical protein